MTDKQQQLKSCIDQFFKSLRTRDFNQVEGVINALIEMQADLPEAADWASYFSGIVASEYQRNWANAELIFQTLLSKAVPPVLRAHVLLALGITYYQQAYWAKSVSVCEESANILAALNYPYKQAVVLRQAAFSYQMGFGEGVFSSETLDKAIAYCQQALYLLTSPPHSTPDTLLYESDLLFYQATTWEALADIHCAAGRWTEAIESYRKFHDLSVQRNNQFYTNFALLGLANAHQQRSQVDWPQAHVYYEQALAGFRPYQDPYNELTVLANQGALYLKQQAYAEALACFEQSLALVETVRTGISTPEARRSFFATVVHIYANTVLAYLALGKVTEAFQTTERARSRAFLDSLFIGETDFSNRIEALPLTPAEIQGKLPADAILLAYFTTGLFETHGGRVTLAQAQRAVLFPKPTTLLFAVTRESITCFDLKVIPNNLYPQDQRNWVEGNFLQPTMLAALYRMLVAPAAGLLADKRRLYVAPHGPLHYVPFQALVLPDNSRWLRPAGPTLVYAPSASVLLTQRPRPDTAPTLSCLAIGCNESSHTTLYLAETEAHWVAQCCQGQALVGPAAKGAALAAQAAQARLLHFACHGEFNLRAPLLSTLSIGREEALTGQAILETLKLRCDVVTLSACESGLNQVQRGDELYGLLRAFLLAGATAVMAALWRVDERPSLLLMMKFYTLVQQGVAYAEALKQAQLYLQSVTLATAQAALAPLLGEQAATYLAEFAGQGNGPIFAAPKYWAAFALIGDPALAAASLESLPPATPAVD
ncbi:MAG: CHAT domain-containing protein [Caldilinea sp. CFX5]|nr:CHAT domain-containing protein [Caldilinea sp. CFX5]